MLLIYNTVMEVAPASLIDRDSLVLQHRELLKEGDIEVIPGWDAAPWLRHEDSFPDSRQIVLMTAAMSAPDSPEHISRVDELIEQHLLSGGRVIVARLYDIDADPRPWDQLRKLGWPRDRILSEWSRFSARPLASIHGVTFREIALDSADVGH
jgi:hypothetical protein